MFIEQLLSFFAWCTLLNYSVLIIWFFIFKLGHDWLHLLHGKWFDLNEQQFDLINYCGMGLFKLLILVFNLAPWIALQLIE
ncbi:DUF6868 family protein [Paraglaciecola arctica]|uniref:DUF6868 family protein n=1 Tax=Paraglaciecola arctica TaxID=1128911 RepID=UPI001C06C963|nr:hypothetical protein [Paraglaciecola arctica]MBU3006072.1 hypothetical protein [Paraglaciecola arctica]